MDLSSKLPDFFVLGATKCGTTSVHGYLRRHPDLFLPYVKELGAFRVPEEDFQEELEDYLKHFDEAGRRTKGEATPGYFRHTEIVPERIKKIYSSREPPKFILVFRDPVERAFSHYLHLVGKRHVDCTFREALRWEQENPERSWTEWKSYFRDGIYADSLEVWLDSFPENRFHILLTRELAQDTDAAMSHIFDFLGVDSGVDLQTDRRRNQAGRIRSGMVKKLLFQPPAWLHSLVRALVPSRIWRSRLRQLVRQLNSQPYEERPNMDSELERELQDRYRPHIRRLEEMIDRDLSDWYAQEGETAD